MSGRLEGKRAIVTGAGQTEGREIGNGRATAIAFAREGAKVVIADLDRASAEATAEAVGEAGGEAEVALGDVCSEEDCRRFVETCTDRFGGLDIVQNNVGIGSGDGWAENIELEAWERIMRVNAAGAMLMAKQAVPVMREGGGGAITNVSSLASVAAGITPSSNAPLGYKMSKAALNALTHSLALNYAAVGIRVNAILPGLIDTPMGVDDVARQFGIDRDDYAAMRDDAVPLRGGMAAPGTWPTPRSSSPPRRPASSPVSCSPSTAASRRGSAEGPRSGRPTRVACRFGPEKQAHGSARRAPLARKTVAPEFPHL